MRWKRCFLYLFPRSLIASTCQFRSRLKSFALPRKLIHPCISIGIESFLWCGLKLTIINGNAQFFIFFEGKTIGAAHSVCEGCIIFWDSTFSIYTFSNSLGLGPVWYWAKFTGCALLSASLKECFAMLVLTGWSFHIKRNLVGESMSSARYVDYLFRVWTLSRHSCAPRFGLSFCMTVWRYDYRFQSSSGLQFTADTCSVSGNSFQRSSSGW